jgi:hypothetical protein
VTGQGHRAARPPADYRVEPALAAQGLMVTVVNHEGHAATFDFTNLPAPETMQRSLAAAFAAQSRGWTSLRSANSYWIKLVIFTRFLAEFERPPQDLDEVTAAMFKRWRAKNIGSNVGRTTLNAVRALLHRDPRLQVGAAAEELARRVPAPEPSKQSYEDAERDRVRLAARRQFRTALLRIRTNTSLLERWRSGELPAGGREERIGQILDYLARTGDVPRGGGSSGVIYARNRKLLGGQGVELTWGRLFLTRLELTALAVLFTDRFGWNLSVFDRMPTPTTTPSAGEKRSVTYHVQVEKRRRGGGHWFDTENITDSGSGSAGRLITEALEATAHARRLAVTLAPGVDLLMTARTGRVGKDHLELDRPRPAGPLSFGVSSDDAKRWVRHHGLDGSPFQRTRRTTVVREGPLQHTRGTHESVYVLPDKRVQRASFEVIEAGAQEALEQARDIVFKGHLDAEPDARHQQTATADCADENNSPWPAPAGGCGADFLLCLACPNAHVHPGHYPRLAHLHQHLHSLRSALPDRHWNPRWREHLLRLEDLRGKVGAPVWTAALAQVTADDRTLISLLLEGHLAP